jgi:hypothetical protein
MKSKLKIQMEIQSETIRIIDPACNIKIKGK